MSNLSAGGPPKLTQPQRTLWIAIGAVAVAGVVAIVGFVWAVATFDDSDGTFVTFGEDYYTDENDFYVTGEISDEVTDLCGEVEEAAGAVQLFSSPAQGSRELQMLAAALEEISVAIGDEASSENVQALAADWQFLADGVTAYATALDAGETPEIDLNDGTTWVPDRIDWSNEACYVPGLVEALGAPMERLQGYGD